MRKVIVLEHISLDGVIQAPGGPDEDTSGGFAFGGWIAPYSDAILGTVLRRQMNLPFDLLLGRKTFDIWAPYWPQHTDVWPGVNAATKYVASNTMTSSEWQPSVFLNGDIAEKVAKIKQQQGLDLHVWGSGCLIQTLIKHDLVDAFWLMIYPITLGVGKRLFADGTIPMAFKVTESKVTPNGVIVANYDRTGAITPEGYEYSHRVGLLKAGGSSGLKARPASWQSNPSGTALKMDKVPPPFDQLIGQELSAVTFVRDYIQLQFNPPPILNVMTPITVDSATGIISQNDPAFPGTIVAQIGKSVISMMFQREQYLRLVFSDDSRITISLKPHDYVGAEALYYSGLGGEWGVL